MPFPELRARVAEVRDRIADAVARGGHGQPVTIVAVTKTFGAEAPRAAHAVGVTDVGENKVQEALGKMPEVGVSLRWHLIGHLQRNKVKALEQFTLFHALDSARLADAVASDATKRGRTADVLMQVNASGEETRGGFEVEEVSEEGARVAGLSGIHVKGVMTMAPFTSDERVLRQAFAGARTARDLLIAAGHEAT